MRVFFSTGNFLLLLAWCSISNADLFRWVDPETGSVKFSSYPPPWYGDPEKERRAPKVERIPAGKAAPATPAQTGTASLEVRRKEMLQSMSALPAREDFNRAGSGLKQQLDAYNALSAELDRLDPKGAQARKAQSQPLLDKLLEGLRAQFSSKPPAAEERGR